VDRYKKCATDACAQLHVSAVVWGSQEIEGRERPSARLIVGSVDVEAEREYEFGVLAAQIIVERLGNG
jgi:hypothetical protein